ncbi:hypothetical protein [Pseudomonas sp. R5(2019)]|uniref:hypothetical protein n=1 Tax=Pseudomonas sp. R5(2019) TaxID=2697566 RepID=UPI0014127E56|nr:hypothetical protein [Pseudomonas sp. R5(2019)]NBA95255.1 hypothetical protein [Pseudomonas sp. R5(2019)]
MRAILGFAFLISVGAHASQATESIIFLSLQHPKIAVSVSKASMQLSTMITEAHCTNKESDKSEPGLCEVMSILKNTIDLNKNLDKVLPKIYNGAAVYEIEGTSDLYFEDYIKSVQSQNSELSESDIVDQTSYVFSVIADRAKVQPD